MTTIHDFAEIIAALEPIAQRTGQACSHVFSDFELRCVRDAISKLRALANVWEALQSSEAYRDGCGMTTREALVLGQLDICEAVPGTHPTLGAGVVTDRMVEDAAKEGK